MISIYENFEIQTDPCVIRPERSTSTGGPHDRAVEFDSTTTCRGPGIETRENARVMTVNDECLLDSRHQTRRRQ